MLKFQTTLCVVVGVCAMTHSTTCVLGKDENKPATGTASGGTAVSTSTGTTTATATTTESSSGRKYGHHLEPILETISATPQQRKQITDIMQDFRPHIEPLQQKYREKQKQFLATMTGSRPAEEVMVRQTELNELYSQISNEYFVMHLKIRRLLTEDQCVKYEGYRRKQGWVK
jgi:Spy/CpxP family protein refolding chaperone